MALLEDLINRVGRQVGRKLAREVTDGAKKAITDAVNNKEKTFTFKTLPANVEELKALKEADMKDYMASAALCVLALNVYTTDPEACYAMMDYLMGPETLSTYQKQFIEGQIRQNGEYLIRSYFKGAVPENNYTPSEPYKVTVLDSVHSKDTLGEGYVTMYVTSGGADSPRGIRLRTKKSTGEWFVNSFDGLFSGIRKPKDEDPWA